jgi:hypothetical protein
MQQIVRPTEKEISTIAYQLWLDRGCPIGSDKDDWFRAEAVLRYTLVVRYEDPSGQPWVLRWEGHWEIWEREWGGARWVWDERGSGVRVSNRTG